MLNMVELVADFVFLSLVGRALLAFLFHMSWFRALPKHGHISSIVHVILGHTIISSI